MNVIFRHYLENDYNDLKNNLIESGQYDPIWDSKENIKDMDIIVATINNNIIGSISIVKYGTFTAQRV